MKEGPERLGRPESPAVPFRTARKSQQRPERRPLTRAGEATDPVKLTPPVHSVPVSSARREESNKQPGPPPEGTGRPAAQPSQPAEGRSPAEHHEILPDQEGVAQAVKPPGQRRTERATLRESNEPAAPRQENESERTRAEITTIVDYLYSGIDREELNITPRTKADYRNIFGLDRVPFARNARVLEIGSGDADVSAQDVGLSEGNFIRTDLSPHPDQTDINQANVLHLTSFDGNEFDETIASFVFRQVDEHLPDSVKANYLQAAEKSGTQESASHLLEDMNNFLGLQAISEMLRVSDRRVRITSFKKEFLTSPSILSLVKGSLDGEIPGLKLNATKVTETDSPYSQDRDANLFFEKKPDYDHAEFEAFVQREYRRLIPPEIAEAMLAEAAKKKTVSEGKIIEETKQSGSPADPVTETTVVTDLLTERNIESFEVYWEQFTDLQPWVIDHSRRVGANAARIAQALGWDDEKVAAARLAGEHHDTGKFLEDQLPPFNSAEVFSTGVRGEMTQRHSLFGSEILTHFNRPEAEVAAARLHHAIGSEEFLAQPQHIQDIIIITAMVDQYDAILVDNRRYQGNRKFTLDDVRTEWKDKIGDHLRPEIETAFLNEVMPTYTTEIEPETGADTKIVRPDQKPISTLLEPGILRAITEARKETARRLAYHEGRDEWDVENSSIESYEGTFAEVLQNRTIADLVEGIDGAVVVDLMAPTGTLADLFGQLPPDPNRLGIAAALQDERIQLEVDRDEMLGIKQIPGDISGLKKWLQNLQTGLEDKKANVIMSRSVAGASYVPDHPQFRRMLMQGLWDMLSEDGGVMLLQYSGLFSGQFDISDWVEKLNQNNITARVSAAGLQTLYIERNPDSPKLLPSDKPENLTSSPTIGDVVDQTRQEQRAINTLIEPGVISAIAEARHATKERIRRNGKDFWPVYNSPIETYDRVFIEVLEGRTIASLLEGVDDAIVVDLMAPSGSIADLFTQLPPDPKRRGIAVSATDERNAGEIARDEELGIVQLPVDITSPIALKKALQNSLGDKKAKIIMESAALGTTHIPDHPQYHRMMMQLMWNFVSEDNGMLLLELPANTDVKQWVNVLQQNNITARTDKYGRSLFMIKTPDSPSELPTIHDANPESKNLPAETTASGIFAAMEAGAIQPMQTEQSGTTLTFGKEPKKRDGRVVNFNVLKTTPENIGKDISQIVVDGEVLDLDPLTARNLGEAVRTTYDIIEKGGVVDCHAFATLLSGQTFMTLADYSTEMQYDFIDKNRSTDLERRFDPLKPVALLYVDLVGDIPWRRTHSVVKLPIPGKELYAHKLGADGEIVISTLEEAAQFYGNTHAAYVTRYTITNPVSDEHLFTRNF